MFVPAHSFVTADGATPAGWMLVLHGIYGSGTNWRTFARRLVDERPAWGCVLVDLRMHGDSQDAPPPHTVASAAGDLLSLRDELAASGRSVQAVAGHSFGGKVALLFRAEWPAGLQSTWVLDSSPSARPAAIDAPENSVVQVLRLLESLDRRWSGREAFVTAVEERGFAPMLARWLAMNVVRDGDDYVLRLEPAAMRALLTDYYQTDAWAAVEDGPGELHAVVAGKSDAVSADDAARFAALAHLHELPTSGHWVHIEALDDLLAMVVAALPEPR